MTSLTKSMNMSGSTGRSSGHKHSHSGNDSDSSFSGDFNDLQMQTRDVGGERLTEADFGDIKGVWASVVIGEIFTDDDDEHELTWENETTDIQLVWSANCNLEGQEGIAGSSGQGWAGWDDTEKCYLHYNTGIKENEHCMRIVKIEVVSKPKPKPKPKPKRKVDRKAERSARKKAKTDAKAAKFGSDSEDDSTCSYIMIKGKSIGSVCGKAMETMTDEGHPLCKKHAKSYAKKVAKANEALVSALSDLGSASESEHDEPARVDRKTTTDSDDDIISDQCVYEFTKGKSKGDACGKTTTTGSDMCSKHKAAVDKKASGGHQSNKIENSDQKGEKSSDMANSTQTKNMSTALMEVLTGILTGALKDNRATKAIAALHTDEAQAMLAEVIKTNMPTKVVRSNGSKRRKKDPAAPKRGCSSYIFFCKHKRSAVKEDNPDMKGTDVTRELGRIWREETSDKKKKRYIKEATEDKERYLEEMKHYTPSDEWLAEAEASDSDDGKKSKRKKSKRKPGPKRARSSYIFFCTDMRSKVKEDNEDMDAKEVTSELGRLWREEYKENADLNKKYIKQSKKDKKRFENEKAEWVDLEPSDDESFAPEPKKSSKKSSKKSNAADSSDDKKAADSSDDEKAPEPTKKSSKKKSSKKKSSKKAAPTGFISFCQQTRKSMREENADWTMKKVTREMERLWASMDSDEQSAYNSE
jgi:hypothetical protein